MKKEEKLANDIVEFLKKTDPYDFENNFREGADDDEIKSMYVDVVKNHDELKTVTESIRMLIRGIDNDPELVKTGKKILKRAEEYVRYLNGDIPVGAIEYLGMNGEIVESELFYNEKEFGENVKHRSYYCIPFNIVIYEDIDGKRGRCDFISELDSIAGIIKILPYESDKRLIEVSMDLIKDYLVSEFGECRYDTFNDLNNIGLAYTETEDGKHEIEVTADLLNFNIIQWVDRKISKIETFKSLKEMNEKALISLDFSELTTIPEGYRETEYPKITRKRREMER